jgi:hypothetical protein
MKAEPMNLKKRPLVAGLCTFTWWVWAAVGQTNLPKLSSTELAALLSAVHPIAADGSTNYSTEHWARILAAAQKVQDSDTDSVEASLRQYAVQNPDLPLLQDTKLLLLLRVVFDVPEAAPPSTRGKDPAFGGWFTMGTDINEDGSVNLAWPISWRRGQPALVSGFVGLQGKRFDASAEYRFFKERYPYRKLAAASK